jgi:solute carrier family 38 (sodium-coupled neutral amino acid transporter), member 11
MLTLIYVAMIAYNVVIGDSFYLLFVKLPQNPNLTSRSWAILIAHVFIVIPISLIRDFTLFAKASLMSLIAIAYLTLVVVVRSAMLYSKTPSTPNAWAFVHPGFFQSIAIISFAYVCHQNVLQIYSSVRRMEKHKFSVATHLSILIALCSYALIGISGYITFTGNTQGNILNNFEGDDTVVIIARFALGLTMLFTYPLVTSVGREVSWLSISLSHVHMWTFIMYIVFVFL